MIVIKAQTQVPGIIVTTKTTYKVFADDDLSQMQEFLDRNSEAEITIQKY